MASSATEPVAQCELCERFPKRGLTRHHLIPRTCHSNKWFRKRYARDEMNRTIGVCRDCHSAIHRFTPSEKELGRRFNTLQKLATHPELARFVAWVRRRR